MNLSQYQQLSSEESNLYRLSIQKGNTQIGLIFGIFFLAFSICLIFFSSGMNEDFDEIDSNVDKSHSHFQLLLNRLSNSYQCEGGILEEKQYRELEQDINNSRHARIKIRSEYESQISNIENIGLLLSIFLISFAIWRISHFNSQIKDTQKKIAQIKAGILE